MRKYLFYFVCLRLVLNYPAAHAQTTAAATQVKPAEIQIQGASIPTRVLVQSPSETVTELQIICLFESETQNVLRGALAETNEKLHGLLDQIRQPSFFRGELGETLVIEPRAGSIGASKLLLIGLGDSQTFKPERMELVGAIVYRESHRLGIAHPYFAPTVLDGGVTKYSTGEISERFIVGFVRGARTEEVLEGAGASQGPFPQDITYLAGPAHVLETQQGLEKGLANAKK
jgi:hypothetical protein